uniref:G_PROTEIN_RECEP_F1_2 domain-containing protein n=1 Tax=Panagrellus redivivus TaxID=6233 RepID=A0A7E4VP32_PANRE
MTNITADVDIGALMDVSSILYWSVVSVGLISCPILGRTLWQLFHTYRISQLFSFLLTIVFLDLIMLGTIIFNVIFEWFPFKGDIVCKLTMVVTNVTACHSNWLWVCMCTQRCVYVFYPMHRIRRTGFWRIIGNTRRLLVITGMLSLMSQIFWFFLVEEIKVDYNGKQASYCGPDEKVIDAEMFTYLETLEVLATYFLPFIMTLMADFAVMCKTYDDKRFKTISPKTIRNNQASLGDINVYLSYKIQSEGGIRAANMRRQRNMRLFLIVATAHGLLNLPYYTGHLVAEYIPNLGGPVFHYVDTAFYIVYLLQFPFKALFVHWLHKDWCQHLESVGMRKHANSNALKQNQYMDDALIANVRPGMVSCLRLWFKYKGSRAAQTLYSVQTMLSSGSLVFLFGMLAVVKSFDSSEIRMLEEEYEKRDPLSQFFDNYAETEKRSPMNGPLVRFGKRSLALATDPLIRFGKRGLDGAPLIRFGKRPDTSPLIRFGKRSPLSSAPHIRFGKRDIEDAVYSSRNRPSPADQDVLLRFGRSTPATMTL